MKQLPPMSEFSQKKQRLHYFNEIDRMNKENKIVKEKNDDIFWHRLWLIVDFFGIHFIDESIREIIELDLEALPYSDKTISELVLKTF